MNSKLFLICISVLVFSMRLDHSFNLLQEPGPATLNLDVLVKIAVNRPCKVEEIILDFQKDSFVLL